MDKLTLALKKKINTFLTLEDELHFSRTTCCYYYEYKTIERPIKSVSLPELLLIMTQDEKQGFYILNNPKCKSILLTHQSPVLPHWILGLPECQPKLALYILNDTDYKNSLSVDEFNYLVNNYDYIKTFVDKHQISLPKLKVSTHFSL